MGKEEDELVGLRPHVPGDDPRFGGADSGLSLVDNGAFVDIENLDDDRADPVDVDDPPFLPQVVDNDGVPGYRPFVDASNTFDQDAAEANPYDVDRNVDQDDAEVAQNSSDVLGDEFHQRLIQREEASTDSVGGTVDDLTQLAQVQAAQAANTAEAAPFRSISPPSSVDALMGGLSVITTPVPIITPDGLSASPPSNAAVEVARWTADSQTEALPVSIGLGRVSPNPTTINGASAGSLLPFRPFATIQWGTRNGAISFEVDANPGTQFTIGATAVNVMLQMDMYKPGTAFMASEYGSLTVAGQLSFYPVVRTTPATRTIYYDTTQVQTMYVQIASATAITIVVPTFAKKLSIFRDDATNADDFFPQDSQGNVITEFAMAASVFYTPEPILLTGDAYFINVNGGGASLANYKFVFELSL